MKRRAVGMRTEDDVEGEEASDSEMRVFTASQLLKQVKRKSQAAATAAALNDPIKAVRVWSPKGEYQMVRRGPKLPDNPDHVVADLQESSMTLFRHVDPQVKFGADPKRPLWVGVFDMSPSLGYGDDEYYLPKQDHLRAMYAQARPLKQRPADNLVPRRSPDHEPLPYWIDAWSHIKNNDRMHKQRSKERRKRDRSEPSSDEDGAGPSLTGLKNHSEKGQIQPSSSERRSVHRHPPRGTTATTMTDYVLPVDGIVMRPIGDALAAKLKKTASQTVSLSTILKQSPMAAVGRVLTETMQSLNRLSNGGGATTGSGPAAKRPKKTSPVRLRAAQEEEEEEEEQDDDEEAPLKKKTKVKAGAAVVQADLTGILQGAQFAYIAYQKALHSGGMPVHPLVKEGLERGGGCDPASLIRGFVDFALEFVAN